MTFEVDLFSLGKFSNISNISLKNGNYRFKNSSISFSSENPINNKIPMEILEFEELEEQTRDLDILLISGDYRDYQKEITSKDFSLESTSKRLFISEIETHHFH